MPYNNGLPNYDTNPYSALNSNWGSSIPNYNTNPYRDATTDSLSPWGSQGPGPWNPGITTPLNNNPAQSTPWSLGGIDAQGWTGIVGGVADLYGAYQKGIQNDNYSKDIAQKQAQWKLNYDRQRDTYNNWANVKNQQSTYTKYNTI